MIRLYRRSAEVMRDAVQTGTTDMVGEAMSAIFDPGSPRKLRAHPTYVVRIKEPTTGIRQLDRATMVQFMWYERQIARLARGSEPKPITSG